MSFDNEELVHAYLRLWAIIENLSIYDVMTRNELLVCYALYYNRTKHGMQTMTPTQIARSTRIRKSQVNRNLNKLEARGLVIRKPSPIDGRKVDVCLSEEGCACFVKEYQRVMDLADGLVTRLGSDRAANSANIINEASEIAEEIFPLEED